MFSIDISLYYLGFKKNIFIEILKMLTPCQSGKIVNVVVYWIIVVSFMGCIEALVGRVSAY